MACDSPSEDLLEVELVNRKNVLKLCAWANCTENIFSMLLDKPYTQKNQQTNRPFPIRQTYKFENNFSTTGKSFLNLVKFSDDFVGRISITDRANIVVI